MEHDFTIENGVLKSYAGREERIVVPGQAHTIGEEAFKGCVSLQKVILPSGLERILAGAFKGCRRLKEIQIPGSVAYVGEYAFHRCHSLEAVALPPSVKELGDCVFLYCDSLTQARIPGVERLGRQVFVNDVLLQRKSASAMSSRAAAGFRRFPFRTASGSPFLTRWRWWPGRWTSLCRCAPLRWTFCG